MKLTVNTEELKKLGNLLEKKEGNLFLSNEAEDILERIQDLTEKIGDIREKARDILKEEAQKYENFQAIKGEKIKVRYQYYGAKYYIEEDKFAKVSENLYKAKTIYNVNSKEVENFIKKNKSLPFGIKESKRQKQLNFKKI